MKRATPGHPKTLHLQELLDIETWGAVGILECLWHFTAAYAPRGDVGRHTDAAIERAIGWRRTPGALVAALREARWVDTCCPEHRLRVHDWPDHADQTVKRGAIVGGAPARSGRPAVPGQGFLECYASAPLVSHTSDTSETLAGTQCEASETQTPGDASETLAADGLPLPLAVAVSRVRMPVPAPADASGEPAPTNATPAEARAVALERLGSRGTPNPLVGDRRPTLEVEWLRLVDWIAKRTGSHPEDVPPEWEGRRGIDPAKLTADRLLRDVMDLRKRRAELEAKDRPPAPDVTTPPVPTLPDAVADEALAERQERMRAASRRLREVLNGTSGGPSRGDAGQAGGDPERGAGGPRDGGAREGARPADEPAADAAPTDGAAIQRADADPPAPGPSTDGRHEFVGRGLIRAKNGGAALCEVTGCMRREDDPVHVARVAVGA